MVIYIDAKAEGNKIREIPVLSKSSCKMANGLNKINKIKKRFLLVAMPDL
jgi:hypothetical protein